MTSRRSFLKGAASAGAAVAAASAGLATAASPLLAEGIAGEFVVAEVKAFEAHPYRWWFSPYSSGDIFTDECDSKEEALRLLEQHGGGVVAECCQQDFDLRVDGGQVLDLLQEQNDEQIGDGDFIHCTPEQEAELGEVVTAAIAAWVEKHGINTTAWTFGDVRNVVEKPRTESSEVTIARD